MRSRWLGVVITALVIAGSVWAYPRLPATVATHWNVRGEPNGFSPRWLAVSFIPAVMVLLTGVLQILPRTDRGGDAARFTESCWLIVNAIILFAGMLHLAIVGNGAGAPLSVPDLFPLGLGLGFLVAGNVLGRVAPNGAIGVRTPWTLASESVWRATNRTAGRLCGLAGIILLSTAFVPRVTTMAVVVLAVAFIAVVPVVQSYVLWRREP
ncbi:MAG TPA: SdpI family protein [Gemmatimonadales bacterium]